MNKTHLNYKDNKLSFLILLVPIILLIPSLIVATVFRGQSEQFIPSDYSYSVAEILSTSYLFILIVWLVWFIIKKNPHPYFNLYSDGKKLLVYFSAPILPFIMALSVNMMVSIPISYIMHSIDHKNDNNTYRIKNKQTYKKDSRCQYRIQLEGSTFLRTKHICGIAKSDWDDIKPGMHIELYGAKSKYGFSFRKYRLILESFEKIPEMPMVSLTGANGNFSVDLEPASVLRYTECVDKRICKKPVFNLFYRNPQLNKLDDPILSITWNMANTYCRFMGKRLPTLNEYQIAQNKIKWPKCCAQGLSPNEWTLNQHQDPLMGTQIQLVDNKIKITNIRKQIGYKSTTVRCAQSSK